MNKLLIGLMCLAGALTACGDANDRAEDQREAQAEANAIAAGAAVAALGLTEMQLLDADIVDGANAEIGDVAGVIRGANGQVERLLVEIEDSNPDRFVHLPIAQLTPVKHGLDTDLSTALTKARLMALPAAVPDRR